MIDVQCVAKDYDFRDTFVLTIVFPLVLTILNVILMAARRCCVSSSLPEKEQAARCSDVTNTHAQLNLLLLFVVYPSVSQTILQMYKAPRFMLSRVLIAP